MPWQYFKITGSDAFAKDAEATNLISGPLVAVYGKAGILHGVEIYHRRTHTGDHAFVISPKAAEIFREILKKYEPSSLPEKPNLEGFVPLRL